MPGENEIIRDILDGRGDFAGLVREHQRAVYAFCLSFLRSPEDAEDAVQDVFVKAYRNLGRFRFESSFFTWLRRIAYCRCIDGLKQRAKRREEAMERDFAEPPASRGSGDGEMIENALAALPEDYRAVLVMREGCGMSYEEIAQAMDISADAVDAKIRRARALFSEKARKFAEDCYELRENR
ncbi:MAG: RNA polymerase sigma factor [Elusimicrobiales bacterium]